MGTRFLAICLIAGLLAACTGGNNDPSPSPSPSPTTATTSPAATSVSATPTRTGPLTTGPNVRPGEKPPVFPELAKQHTTNGALVFGAYYFKAFDWGYATNDGSLVKALVSPQCEGCSVYLNGLRSLRRDGETLTGGRIVIRSASIAQNRYKIDADYVVDVAVDEEPIVLHEAMSTKTAAAASRDLHSLVFVRWIGNRWQVIEVTKP